MTGSEVNLKDGRYVQSGESGEVFVSVNNVSKKFCKSLKLSMFYGMMELSKNLVGIKPDTTALRRNEFWALNNVSFKLRKGRTLGVIGVNGSGKTTLLRLISGIFPPDKGEIITRGRVAALISLGAGFHPHMTGRENIYVNGAILGMSRREINSKFQFITDFSELGDFIDAPVSTYSSGMKVRLGFSIAISIQPDILILDEVLAVGDKGFKAKCYHEIDKLSRNAAIIFVSQSMQKIARICSEIIVMNHGKIAFRSDDVSAGIEYYYSQFAPDESSISGTEKATVHDVKFVHGYGLKSEDDVFTVEYLDSFTLEIVFSMDASIQNAIMNIAFFDKEYNNVANCKSKICNFGIRNISQTITLRVKFPELQLSPGKYSVSVIITDQKEKEILLRYHSIKDFKVAGAFTSLAPFHLQADWSYV